VEVFDTPGAAPEDFRLQDYADRSFGIYQDESEEGWANSTAPSRQEPPRLFSGRIAGRFGPGSEEQSLWSRGGGVALFIKAGLIRRRAWDGPGEENA